MVAITLLGEQTIVDDNGRPLTRSGPTTALVGLLASHHDLPQPRSLVAESLWPDSTTEQARTNLRRELHHLRRVLGDDPALSVTPTHLCWRQTPACRVDVVDFREACTRALAATDDEQVLAHGGPGVQLRRGRFLPATDAEWVATTRDDLDRQFLALCDTVAAAAGRLGEHAVALDAARRRVALTPLDEVAHRRLMSCLLAAGDRGGAVSAYHACASRLEEELGIGPDAETVALLDRALGRSAHPSPDRSAPPGRTALVARQPELAVLRRRWRRAGSGEAGVVVVRGGPGVGKTRLVAELASDVRRAGGTAARASCPASPGRLSLAPVATWLADGRLQAAQDRLASRDREQLARLAPGAGAPQRPAADTRHLLFEAVARCLRAAGAPVLLVLDDLQWCDPDTLSCLTYVLHRCADAPLLLVATVRTGGDPQRRLDDWLARLPGPVDRVDLEPLDVRGVGELVAALGETDAPSGRAELLHAVTGGFPLFVVEAVRSGGGDLRDARDVLGGRLGRLRDEARDVAALAAAVGREFSLPLLDAASDLPTDAVAAAVDELWHARIVRQVGDDYDFSHDLLREAAYELVGPPRRWLLHRRIAGALELTGRSHLDRVAPQLAEQHWRSGDRRAALGFLDRAADVARSMSAHAESVRLARARLGLVRELPAGRDRDGRELECLVDLGGPLTALQGFAHPEVQTTYERVIDLATALGRGSELADGTIGLWACRYVQGHNRHAFELATGLARRVGDDDPYSGQARFVVAASTLHLGRPTEALDHFDAACALLRDEVTAYGSRALVHARAWSAHAAWLVGDVDGAATRCVDSVAAARRTRHPYSLALALSYAAVTHQLLDDRAALASDLDELEPVCRRYEIAYYAEWADLLRGWLGRDARRARTALARLHRQGAYARTPYWLDLVADVEEHPDARRATVDAALVAARARDDLWWVDRLRRRREA